MAISTPYKVLLTGASSGIGQEIAQQLTAGGWEVWGTSRTSSKLKARPHFHPVVMDLGEDDSIRRGFSMASLEAGGFEVLINNAGSGVFGPTTQITSDIAREQFQLLVHGPLELIRLAIPYMRQCQRGLIINISSLAANLPIPYMGAYNAAKAALSSYSHCLRLELAHTSIRIIDVRPADINTDFHGSTLCLTGNSTDCDAQRLTAVWETQRRNMRTAPPPSLVAMTIWDIMNNPNPPSTVTVGGFFQSKAGPWLLRHLPVRLQDSFLSRFYGILR